jgi:hypothetical protein
MQNFYESFCCGTPQSEALNFTADEAWELTEEENQAVAEESCWFARRHQFRNCTGASYFWWSFH